MQKAVEHIGELAERARAVLSAIKEQGFAPSGKKELNLRFTMKQAEELVGRTGPAIRDAETSGRMSPPDLNDNNRRLGFTQKQLNELRTVFNTQPWIKSDEEPVTVAFSSFKGGVGKSTSSVHFAQYMALRGYRVLMIDCDPQGSTTSMFGYIPDTEIEEEDTLGPYFTDEETTLDYAIRKTYWDGLDLIPANLLLFESEYLFIAGKVRADTFLYLRQGIDTIKHNYDVIIIDPPPSLGLISLNVMMAASALVIPVPAQYPDLSSTATYLQMLENNIQTVSKYTGEEINYLFTKMLISRFDEGLAGSAQSSIAQIYDSVFGSTILNNKFRQTKQIENAYAKQRTVYELTRDEVNSQVHKRAINILDGVFGEIEMLIRMSWPSHKEELRKLGKA